MGGRLAISHQARREIQNALSSIVGLEKELGEIMTGYAPSHLVPLIERSVRDTHKAGLIMQTADDVEYVGRYVQIEGRSLLNFGGCSYLGLEQRPELKDAA